MSEPVKPILPDQLVSPGVRDDRQITFARMIDGTLREIDLNSFVMTNAQTVDARLLPALVREFSVEEFVSPDLPENVVRDLIDNRYELHAKKGYVEGVRLGLSLLGISVSWQQWWQQDPMGPHNTHIVTIEIDRLVFEDSETLLDERLTNAAYRMIDAMKRWSQEIALRLAARSRGKLYTAAFPATRLVTTALPFFLDPPVVSGPMRAAVAPLSRLIIVAHAAA
ncbi:MAG: phage tail protein I [Hoeflea sp.]|uniref:phage tail protein I n=1 Tax=Hoeflea sp. TaxID=1940281 RepID=UPI000C0DA8F9|nr:phage tail protein I [Hoeflea sp.]PHR19303.1 MAG: phage tail protein I [Hoeflea sp.]